MLVIDRNFGLSYFFFLPMNIDEFFYEIHTIPNLLILQYFFFLSKNEFDLVIQAREKYCTEKIIPVYCLCIKDEIIQTAENSEISVGLYRHHYVII